MTATLSAIVLSLFAAVRSIDAIESTSLNASSSYHSRIVVPFRYAWRFHYGPGPDDAPGVVNWLFCCRHVQFQLSISNKLIFFCCDDMLWILKLLLNFNIEHEYNMWMMTFTMGNKLTCMFPLHNVPFGTVRHSCPLVSWAYLLENQFKTRTHDFDLLQILLLYNEKYKQRTYRDMSLAHILT